MSNSEFLLIVYSNRTQLPREAERRSGSKKLGGPSSRWKNRQIYPGIPGVWYFASALGETPLLWKRKRLTRGSGTRLGEGRRIRSGAGRGLGYHGNRDAQAGREPNLAANAPPILSMAPKKEKGTGSANSKIWEPSLIAAHLNQVSLPSQVSPSPGPR